MRFVVKNCPFYFGLFSIIVLNNTGFLCIKDLNALICNKLIKAYKHIRFYFVVPFFSTSRRYIIKNLLSGIDCYKINTQRIVCII